MTVNRHEDPVKLSAIVRRTQLSRRSFSNLMREVRSGGSSGQIVAMMQTAEPGHRNDSAFHPRVARFFTTGRRTVR